MLVRPSGLSDSRKAVPDLRRGPDERLASRGVSGTGGVPPGSMMSAVLPPTPGTVEVRTSADDSDDHRVGCRRRPETSQAPTRRSIDSAVA